MNTLFQTPRLLLRRFTIEDAPLVFALNSQPEVVKYVHERLLESDEDAQKILEENILPQYQLNLGRWAMHLKENNEFIGWCGLKQMNDIIDLGYRLHPRYWGKGYATEAAKHTLDYGFTQLNVPLITGKAHVENTASVHVLEKIGMQFIKEALEDGIPIKTYTAANPSR